MSSESSFQAERIPESAPSMSPESGPAPDRAPEPAPAASPENTQADRTPEPAQEGQREGKPKEGAPRDTVFIGKKPLMAYVTLTILQLAELSSVNIRARGMSISRAVDVAQIISRKRDNARYTIGAIELGSETLQSNDGKQRNVSTINIVVNQN